MIVDFDDVFNDDQVGMQVPENVGLNIFIEPQNPFL